MGTAAEMLTLVDIGSNAVRCLLVELTPGDGFEIVRQERVQTRLGGGCQGILPRAAVDETVAAVRQFLKEVRQTIPRGRSSRVLAIATAAVRDATNREDLLGALKREGDITVRILSGEEEARLGALAALERLAFRDGVVIDLGGGSLQISQVRAGGIHCTASLPLGAVRTTQRFFKNDPPTKQEILALRTEVRKQIGSALPPALEAKSMVGIGGTIRTLAAMHLASLAGARPSRQGFRLWRSDITCLREQLEELPARERRRLPGLKEERVDIILSGAVVVEEVMALGNYGALTVCKDGVRHGLLLHEVFYGSA